MQARFPSVYAGLSRFAKNVKTRYKGGCKGYSDQEEQKTGILVHLQHKKLNKKEKNQGDNFTRDYRLFLYKN